MPGGAGVLGVTEGLRDGAAGGPSYDSTKVSGKLDRSPDEEDEDHERDGYCFRTECIAALICVLIFAGVGACMISYGPTRVLRNMLILIPEKPGWGFYICMGLCTMVSIVMILPIWPPMCMAAGLIFGLFWGAALNFCSILGAAMCSIVIGRFLLREPVRRWLDEGEYPSMRKLMHVLEDEESSLKFQMLFRFLFLPMFVRNYGPSTLHVPLWKLFIACIPHSIWISFLFASLGATFTDAAALIRDRKDPSFKDMKWQQLAIFCVSFTVAIGLAIYAQRKYMEHLENEQAALAAQADREKQPEVAAPTTA